MAYLPKSYKINRIRTFTKDVKLFEINSDLNPKPGQFIQVSILGIGECPLASCSYNSKQVNLLTKNAGNVTSGIFNLEIGNELFIRGPYGNGFPLKEFENKNLILVAGGTGIAPVISLIEYIEQNRKKFKQIFIYFGFKNRDHLLLKGEIRNWEKKFNLIICLDENKGKNCNLKCETGFVHEVMKKNKPLIEETIAVMCGPEVMMKCVTDTLNGLGISNENIYWSMERRMECGFGSCNRCLIQDLYVCKDGPVFRYDIIKPRLDNENSN